MTCGFIINVITQYFGLQESEDCRKSAQAKELGNLLIIIKATGIKIGHTLCNSKQSARMAGILPKLHEAKLYRAVASDMYAVLSGCQGTAKKN
jgi:hypothetical protein